MRIGLERSLPLVVYREKVTRNVDHLTQCRHMACARGGNRLRQVKCCEFAALNSSATEQHHHPIAHELSSCGRVAESIDHQ